MSLPPEVIDDLFRSIPTHDPGVYVDRGVAGTLIVNVYAFGSKRILSCQVAADDADEELVHALEAFAARQAGVARLRLS
ncbi:MAG TPA: hypothetical protein VF102_07110 [Gemmatimonadaceae bacterium]